MPKVRGKSKKSGTVPAKKKRWFLRKRVIIPSLFVFVLIVFSVIHGITNSSPQASPQPTVATSQFPPVDGISCDQVEQRAFLIHAHISIWIDGKETVIPANIGIAPDQSCFYWLHTHDTTGIVFIAAPEKGTFTLRQFIDIWQQGQTKGGFPSQLSEEVGWTVFIEGTKVSESFDKVLLGNHTLITLAFNSPGVKGDTTYSWPDGM